MPMRGWYSRMAAIGLGLTAFAIRDPAMAQNETVPSARAVNVDWSEVARGALAVAPELRAPPKSLAAKLSSDVDRQLEAFVFADKEALRPLAWLNVMTAGVDPSIAKV